MNEFDVIKSLLTELSDDNVDFTEDIDAIEKNIVDPPIPLWLIKLIIKLAKKLKPNN